MSTLVSRPPARPARAELAVLRLPMPAEPFDAVPPETDALFYADLALAVQPVGEALAPPEDPDERAWYRWVLGHHVAFCTWRRLAEVLDRMVHKGLDVAGSAEAAWWFDCYSAMFLYAGSCPADTYARVVRPRMVAADPAFSGIWARDYAEVNRLLGLLRPSSASALKKALKRNRLVHATTAKTLVPDGESLLKENGPHARKGPTAAERDVFDRLFLVERRPVSRDAFAAQAVHRVAAVHRDLVEYPFDVPAYESVYRLLPDDLTSMVRDMAIVLAGTYLGEVLCIL